MCGTAGLFVGCQVEATCPRRLLTRSLGGSAEDDTDEVLRNPFSGWYDKASVRAAPRRVLRPLAPGQHFFPPELVPVASHALTLGLPPDAFEELLVRHLYRYLQFTIHLETMVVNHTALGLAMGTAVPSLSRQARLDAYRVYCDESYHALFSADLVHQLGTVTGIAPPAADVPAFMHRLGAVLESAEPEHRSLLELMFVIVSETLITGTLAQVHTRPRVSPAVAESVRDHALDEGRHHVFFADLLTHVWRRLDRRQAAAIGVRLPDLISCFLEPATEPVLGDLVAAGLPERFARKVVAETFTHPGVEADIKASASATVRRFADAGAMEVPEVGDALGRAGLLA
jgi:hypothetical protein